jgi:hypothetical protein
MIILSENVEKVCKVIRILLGKRNLYCFVYRNPQFLGLTEFMQRINEFIFNHGLEMPVNNVGVHASYESFSPILKDMVNAFGNEQVH